MVSTAPRKAEKTPDTEPTVRLTVAQATIRFLANQFVERDGERTKFFAGCFGIFRHCCRMKWRPTRPAQVHTRYRC